MKYFVLTIPIFFGIQLFSFAQRGLTVQPELVSRAAPLLHLNGLRFKDLNKNGLLDPYED